MHELVTRPGNFGICVVDALPRDCHTIPLIRFKISVIMRLSSVTHQPCQKIQGRNLLNLHTRSIMKGIIRKPRKNHGRIMETKCRIDSQFETLNSKLSPVHFKL